MASSNLNQTENNQIQLNQFIDSLLHNNNPINTSFQPLLTQIDLEIKKVQTHIQSSLKSDWPTFQNQSITGSSLYYQSLHLENQLDQLETKLDNPQDGLVPTLLSALKNRQEIATQRRQSLQNLQVINSLSTAYQEIVSLSKLIYSNHLITAVSTLPQAKLALKILYPSPSASSLAKRAIYRIQELEEDLKQRLIDDVRSCFTFQDAQDEDLIFEFKPDVNGRASSQQTDSFTPWSSAVEALETLSGKDGIADQLKKIVTLLIDKIVTPLIESSISSPSHLILVQRQTSDQSSCLLGFKHQVDGSKFDLYDSLRLLFNTLQEKLLTSKSLQDNFSQLLIPSLEDKLLSQVLASELPNSTRDEPRLSQLSLLLTETRRFGNWLEDRGWLSHMKHNSLLDWCDQVQNRFLHKVATRVLELARHEMVTTQWESTQVSWEIISEIETPLPPSSRQKNLHRAQTKPILHPPSSSKSLSLTPQQLPESPKQSVGFKSLFRFVSGNSTQEPPEALASSSSPKSKKFESLFDFGITEPRVATDSYKSSDHLQYSSKAQNPSSNIVDHISGSSQPSSPKLKSKLSSSSLSSTKPIASTQVENQAEEDIDWNMSGELEESSNFDPTSSAHCVNPSHVDLEDDEIEEDAWGLDGSNEEPLTTTISDTKLSSPSATTDYVNSTHSHEGVTLTDHPTSISQQPAEDLEEEEELDPDAWGFEEQDVPTLTDDDGGLLRLRGGVGSSPSTSELPDEDGWGWNEDATVENFTNKSTRDRLHQSSAKNKNDVDFAGSNDKSPIRVEQLSISTLAQKVLSIVQQAVDDAIQTEFPEFPNESLRYSGPGLIKIGFDVIDLFRITMLFHHSKLLNSVPSLSVQFSNDCDWLSHQLELIPKLKNEYQDEVNTASNKLKASAIKVRRNQIANQKAALMDCLNEAEGFVETSREDRFSACQRACKQVVHTLETLAQVWKPVMLRKEYLESLGELVETVLKRILNEIEEQTDIEEKESNSLNQICKSLHPLINLFNSLHPGSGSSPSDDDVYHYVPSWFKFCFLSELLEASMADIMWMYQEGHLSEFSKQEIVGLIKALFADSQLRAKNIDLILQ